MADPHTGLANKLLLADRLTQALVRRRRHGGEVVVCHIDLDNLGEINLDLGYTTGNTVLCEGARRLTAILRAEDTVGRVGGSELVVVVAVNEEQDVRPLVRRLQQTLEEPVTVGGQRIRMHARLGVAVAQADDEAEDVLGRADHSTRGQLPLIGGEPASAPLRPPPSSRLPRPDAVFSPGQRRVSRPSFLVGPMLRRDEVRKIGSSAPALQPDMLDGSCPCTANCSAASVRTWTRSNCRPRGTSSSSSCSSAGAGCKGMIRKRVT